MTNFIPVFPLDIVVYPNEILNIHVFEPKYKQLITECINEKKPFGIPCVMEKKMQEYGTLMEVTEVVKQYDNGEMDVRIRGQKVFRLLEVIKDIPEKEYMGAIVTYPENNMDEGDSSIAQVILNEVKRLYSLLNVEEKFPKKDGAISYTIAHFVGFSRQQEYEVLGLFQEIQRLEYIRRHLHEMIPVVQELEQMKARIQLNGHFRNLSLGDLDL